MPDPEPRILAETRIPELQAQVRIIAFDGEDPSLSWRWAFFGSSDEGWSEPLPMVSAPHGARHRADVAVDSYGQCAHCPTDCVERHKRRCDLCHECYWPKHRRDVDVVAS